MRHARALIELIETSIPHPFPFLTPPPLQFKKKKKRTKKEPKWKIKKNKKKDVDNNNDDGDDDDDENTNEIARRRRRRSRSRSRTIPTTSLSPSRTVISRPLPFFHRKSSRWRYVSPSSLYTTSLTREKLNDVYEIAPIQDDRQPKSFSQLLEDFIRTHSSTASPAGQRYASDMLQGTIGRRRVFGGGYIGSFS